MKKKSFLFAFLLVLTSYLSMAQDSSNSAINERSIYKKINAINSNNVLDPKEKEEQLLQLKTESEKIGYNSGSLRCGNLLIRLYANQNRFKEAIGIGNELKKIQGNKNDNKTLADIYRQSALAHGYLGFYDASLKDFKTAIRFAEGTDDQNSRAYLLSLCYENLTMHHIRRQFEDKRYRDSILYYTEKSLETAKQIQDNNSTVSNDLKYDHIAFSHMRLGIFYLEQVDQKGSLALAEKHLLEGLKINENKKYNIPLNNKTMMMNQLSWLYLEKKDYSKAIEFSNRALSLEKQFKDAYHRVESYEFLASSYLEIGDKEKSKFYMDKYSFLEDSLKIAEKNGTDSQVEEIIATIDEKNEKSTKQKMFLIGMAALLLIIGFYVFWKRKNKIIHQKYEELIVRINKQNTLLEDREITGIKSVPLASDEGTIKPNTGKNLHYIRDVTTKNLLQKIERFEKSDKYLKKEMSLTYMANSIGTNTKYLSEIIKQYKGKSFNNYINGLRIDYILRQLYSNPKLREYKISHLADLAGFSSREVFAVVFKKETNITPSFFIEKLKNDQSAMEMAV